MTEAPTPGSEQTSDTVRVLLVDDQPLLRAGFAMVIDSQPDMSVVTQASDGLEALTALMRHSVDVVLMDIRMPNLDGIEATSRILSGEMPLCSTPKIIVLTTFDTDEYAVQALRVGAAGFLLKDVEPEVLLDSIRNVTCGGAVIAPTTTRRLLDSAVFAVAESHTSPGAARILNTLTPRERDILVELTTGDPNVEIAQRLQLSEATVKTHVSRIFTKLDVRDRVQAVVFAYESGFVSPQSR